MNSLASREWTRTWRTCSPEFAGLFVVRYSNLKTCEINSTSESTHRRHCRYLEVLVLGKRRRSSPEGLTYICRQYLHSAKLCPRGGISLTSSTGPSRGVTISRIPDFVTRLNIESSSFAANLINCLNRSTECWMILQVPLMVGSA